MSDSEKEKGENSFKKGGMYSKGTYVEIGVMRARLILYSPTKRKITC